MVAYQNRYGVDSESEPEDDNYFDDVNDVDLPHTYDPIGKINFIERKSSYGNIYVEYTGINNFTNSVHMLSYDLIIY